MTARTVLVVDDEADVRLPMRRFLERRGFEVAEAGSVKEGAEAFAARSPDVTVLDYSLPDGDGLELLGRLRRLDPAAPVVVLTAHGSIDLAVQAIKQGAEQFLTKPVELPALLVMLERLIENRRLRQIAQAGRARQEREALDPFVGDSPAIRRLAERAARVAGSAAPVLIQGDTGSGKGVLARWLHERGPRAQQAFVDLNCAGLSRELVESELFGHQKGAFTGAVSAKPGLLEVAHRGTLFLDEIGDLDALVQAKLLKVVEEMRFRRLGEVQDRRVEVRFIAATHRDLAERVREGAFREDLYYRIRGVPLRVPSLRERGRDLIVLARQLVARVAAEVGRPEVRLSGAAEQALLGHAWPGNLRELRNVLEHAVLLGRGVTLEPADFVEWLAGAGPARPGRPTTLAEAERRHIEEVLHRHDFVVPRAAEALGISRTALYERVRKHAIRLPRRR